MQETIGFAWVFENAVIFGDVHAVLTCLSRRNAKKRYGIFLGVVKGLIPKDPYCTLILDFHHTKGYRQRMAERKILHRLGLSRRKIRRWQRLPSFFKKSKTHYG